MNSGLTVKKVVLIFAVVLAIYFAMFVAIEKSRLTKGPWRVEFQAVAGGDATLIVAQPYLNVTNARIVVHGETITNFSGQVTFDRVKQPVPFGSVIFEDLTFLPGVVTFNLLGHEVELMPRALVVNKKLVPWQPGMTVELWPTNKPAEPPHAPKIRRS